jgi:hypothetical protein
MLSAIGLVGCAHVEPQPTDNVAQVARNVSKSLPEQSRLLMCSVASPKPCGAMPGPADRDVVRQYVRNNATLSCEIATRDDKTTAVETPACKCARFKSADDFEVSCASWAGVQ